MSSTPSNHQTETCRIQTHQAADGVLQVETTALGPPEDISSDESWSPGFPYFGEAAEALDALDLWNRSKLQYVLYHGSRYFLGDRILWRLRQARWVAGRLLAATIEVRDPENGTLHQLRYQSQSGNFA